MKFGELPRSMQLPEEVPASNLGSRCRKAWGGGEVWGLAREWHRRQPLSPLGSGVGGSSRICWQSGGHEGACAVWTGLAAGFAHKHGASVKTREPSGEVDQMREVRVGGNT